MGIGWKTFLLIGILLLAGELFIPEFFPGAVGVAFIAVSIFLAFGITNPILLILAFLISGGVSVLLLLYLFKKMTPKTIATGADQFVGQVTRLVKTVEKQGMGQLKIGGEVWSVSTKDPEITIPAGSRVRIVGHEGIKLIVEEVREEEGKGTEETK